MKYALDTNACVNHLKSPHTSPVSRKLASVVPRDVGVSSVVRAELLYGATRSREAARNLAQVREFCGRFDSIPFDDTAAEVYATNRAALAHAGTPIGPNDLMIAAIARANELTLVTHNTGEFSRVPGLKLEDWEMAP